MSESAPRPFDVDRLRRLLGEQAAYFDVREVVECASTNALLMGLLGRVSSGTLVVADRQTAGRGRRGRSWQSTAEASLTASLAWRFDQPASTLSSLPLVVGLALAEGLEHFGARPVGLKWPNDLIVVDDAVAYRKLGGVLVELNLTGNTAVAVIGFGLNLYPFAPEAGLDTPMAALSEWLREPREVNREALLAVLLPALAARLGEFAASGFVAADAWTARHALQGRDVRVSQTGLPELVGRCQTVDADGALRLSTAVGEVRIVAGDLSLRAR